MQATFTRFADGKSELINMIPTSSGALVRPGLAINAVVVQLIPMEQEDGTIENARVTSILCADDEMLPALRVEAQRLIESAP